MSKSQKTPELVPPPGYHVRKTEPKKLATKHRDNKCEECIDDSIFSKLLSFVSIKPDKREKTERRETRKKKPVTKEGKSRKVKPPRGDPVNPLRGDPVNPQLRSGPGKGITK